MKDHQRTLHTSGRSSKGRLSNYEQEMDHAFTLIFHNIRRLQDGVLSNSDPNLTNNFSQEEMAKPAVSKTETIPVRKRSGSEPYLGYARGQQKESCPRSLAQEQKSGSFHAVSAVSRSPTHKRKVRFADDYATEEKSGIRTQKLSSLASERGLYHRQDLLNYSPSNKKS